MSRLTWTWRARPTCEAVTVIRHGDFPAAASLIAEADVVSEATRIRYPPFAVLWLTCLSGNEAEAAPLIEATITADGLYRQAIDQLSRTRLRSELARAHLLYGEWLRREGRRAEARTHLRSAYQMLAPTGAAAFADRARRELLAAGETVRKRAAENRTELTAQEAVHRPARA